MNKNEKYKKIAKLFFSRLIILQKEFRDITEIIEEIAEKHKIRICVEIGDFIPLIKFAEILEIPNENNEAIMYDEIDKLIENQENFEIKVEKFLEKYVETKINKK